MRVKLVFLFHIDIDPIFSNFHMGKELHSGVSDSKYRIKYNQKTNFFLVEVKTYRKPYVFEKF